MLPFDHERQLASVLVRDPGGQLMVIAKGAPEVVLDRCAGIPAGARPALDALFRQGARVVAVASRPAGDTRTLSAEAEHRLALEGFLAFAPDALFPLGGYPGDEDRARELFAKLDQIKTREDFVAAAAFLRARPECSGKLGVVGFCYGGGIANFLATRLPDLNGAVPFYGMAPALDQVPHIKAPLLIHFAENDDRINASWPPYEAALEGAGVKYEAFKYPGTQHGFNNDTTPRYDAAAAKLAWQRTIAFFEQRLDKA